MGLFQLPALPESVARRTFAKSLRNSGVPDEFVDRYAAAMAEPGALTGALNWYRGIPFSTRPPVGRITVPTTYIWGRHDVALARAAAELTANYVAGPYEVVELDAGHWLPETEPDAVADGILARVRAS
jgi:pimeloyl-ACP methyl ester carboxylesterase